MKKLFVLAFATTFSVLNCAHTIQDHMGPMQHQKLTPHDGAWYLLRTMEQNTLEPTRFALAALPKDQRVGQFLPVSILVGFQYVQVRLSPQSYFYWITQIKQIQLTPTERHAFELILNSNELSTRNNNLNKAR